MALGYQMSPDPSMSTPMLSPRGVIPVAPIGGDGSKRAAGKLAGAFKSVFSSDGSAAPAAPAQPGSMATDIGFDTNGGMTTIPDEQHVSQPMAGAGASTTAGVTGPGQTYGGDVGNTVRAHGAQPVMNIAASPTVQAPLDTPLGYSAADVGGAAWQPRSATGYRPMGF